MYFNLPTGTKKKVKEKKGDRLFFCLRVFIFFYTFSLLFSTPQLTLGPLELSAPSRAAAQREKHPVSPRVARCDLSARRSAVPRCLVHQQEPCRRLPRVARRAAGRARRGRVLVAEVVVDDLFSFVLLLDGFEREQKRKEEERKSECTVRKRRQGPNKERHISSSCCPSLLLPFSFFPFLSDSVLDDLDPERERGKSERKKVRRKKK